MRRPLLQYNRSLLPYSRPLLTRMLTSGSRSSFALAILVTRTSTAAATLLTVASLRRVFASLRPPRASSCSCTILEWQRRRWI